MWEKRGEQGVRRDKIRDTKLSHKFVACEKWMFPKSEVSYARYTTMWSIGMNEFIYTYGFVQSILLVSYF